MVKKRSFMTEVAEIAEELHIPKATVEQVLRTRLKHQLEALKNGESVTEEGLFTIRAVYDEETDSYTYRGATSAVLREAVYSNTKRLRLLSKLGDAV